jgi:hypothetical protein
VAQEYLFAAMGIHALPVSLTHRPPIRAADRAKVNGVPSSFVPRNVKRILLVIKAHGLPRKKVNVRTYFPHLIILTFLVKSVGATPDH